MPAKVVGSRGDRAAQGRTWAALVLLGLVVLIPAFTVGWLVLQASKNRQLAVQKMYEDAREGFLEAGSARLLGKLEEFRKEFDQVLRDAPEGLVRSAILDWGRIDGFADFPAQWTGGARESAPMMAYREVETATGPAALTEARWRFKEIVMAPRMQSAMPPTQCLFYLARLVEWDDDPAVARAHDFALNSVRWMEAVERGRALREGFVAQAGDLFGLWSTDESALAVLESDSLASLMQAWLNELPRRAGGSLTVEPVAETSSGSSRVEGMESATLPPPLGGWRIVFMPDQSGADLADADRNILWLSSVSALVIGLSLALSLLLYRVMQRQAKLTQLKNDLVATVSHELKTPVASIRLLVDTLRADANLDPIRVRDYLGLISRENLRLGHLIENFLSFSRMERNKDSFDLQPVSPGEVALEVEKVFRERQPGWEGDLGVEIAPDLPEVMADREALQTAIGNLLENAQKYSNPPPWIRLSVRQAQGVVEFAVADHGRGIAREDQKRIFEKFYQARTRLSEHVGGVGLGLSIVAFIVQKHRGELKVESEPGRGSVFTIRLPRAGGGLK